jgi:hypothetical protein
MVYFLDDTAAFDEHGDLPSDPDSLCGSFELKLKVTTETIYVYGSQDGVLSRRRMLYTSTMMIYDKMRLPCNALRRVTTYHVLRVLI